jgi:hypothetical protein
LASKIYIGLETEGKAAILKQHVPLMLRAVCVMEPEVPPPTPHHRNLYYTVRAPCQSLLICRFCWSRAVVTGWGEARFGLRSSV